MICEPSESRQPQDQQHGVQLKTKGLVVKAEGHSYVSAMFFCNGREAGPACLSAEVVELSRLRLDASGRRESIVRSQAGVTYTNQENTRRELIWRRQCSLQVFQ